MKVVNNIAELIGNTPIVKLNRLNPKDGADIYVKLEYFNPSGSVKDRAAYNMIIEAEKQGLLTPNSTIIEPTSGNTGIGIAMNAAARGYKAILVMPDTMTQERVNLLKAYGAEVILTPGDEKMQGSIRKAEQLSKEIPNAFIPMQFENRANPDAHRLTTAKEIIDAMNELGKSLSAFVATAGTGGTITGTGESLKEYYKDLHVHVVEPAGSPVLSGGKPGKHKLVGTSPGFIPSILNEKVYDEILKIEDDQAYEMTRRLAREEGILVGPSSGAACYAAIEVANRLTKNDVVVCMIADTGERYLSSDVFDY
ncbi:cysteine synthase A [Metabacillus sediminilitoris]|uniref:Cysteine synthase n=1 Tax=Metabacillus sediminilitoris TaxID=2567941 RepID=A0A4S4C2T5_9BACI|nr:cysteine synthase A [Metabacillus sediminilitoris]QGQ47571.1 cysteine synthase A [Metabacillus sediminilitoris]THF82004.1 cysteine synthase A [Metabacillus sediminilitoris]